MRKIIIRSIIITVAFLITAQRATAEPLIIPLAVYATAASADLHSTHRFLQYEGIHEGNPLGSWVKSPDTLVVYSVVLDATVVTVLHKLIGEKHPKFERIALYSVAGVRMGIAARNYRITEGHQRKVIGLK